MGWAMWLWASILGSAILGALIALAWYGTWRFWIEPAAAAKPGEYVFWLEFPGPFDRWGNMGLWAAGMIWVISLPRTAWLWSVDRRRRSTRPPSASVK